MSKLGLPGRTGSNRNTELGALNEIIKRLTDLRNAVTSSSSGGGDASLAEQQLQTTELVDINTELLNLDMLLTSIDSRLSTIANAPEHVELTDPVAVNITGYKEISFVCSGTIDVTINGNTITYPYTLGTATILGSTLKADTISINDVTFNGTGTVLLTTQY